ncbi:Transcription initiation factor IIA small chain (TFIIA 13.5 kDa subunit) [Lobosporangium transversale]|uniref:Transcription initiation factor IIA subunit 2 n=1 Tax=Lobosporangium transversale TaxID=64571 RepID=A0A1Y2G6C7_9FUNG|nr:transcription initiation factor IIA, gamma subunit, helical domain-domain-containing protein [Lobosporangium transversale]KAF9901695.1 Transcription initiation factor IIA small chain (TFIIA 13.5 kDa subunit) [Lobosporangium transversale]ORY97125.1 transcription initiation factor IIA, gamma subunit, helical domain-domain-containing protein [Lobosporangium transversale]|eukprot:XP_021875658.1 transcription initiation factor IIA, gamma subunit, helical domain-domain-containing protein [Lobosporangium transversale]
MSQYYEHYRKSSIGLSLIDSLDELIQSGHINPQLAMRVLAQFDMSIADALSTRVRTRATFKAHLDNYRSLDDVWTFVLSSPTFRYDNESVTADKVKIVACKARVPGEV